MTILKAAALAAALIAACTSPLSAETLAHRRGLEAALADMRAAEARAAAIPSARLDNLIVDPDSRVYCVGYGSDAHCDIY
jgi:hypothetical protein